MSRDPCDSETWSVPEETGAWRSHGAMAPHHSSAPALLTAVEPHLMRGVDLATCLSGWAKHWGTQSASSMYETERQNYSLSFTVAFYHNFLSHDWKTSRAAKLCAMLTIFNSRPACCFAVCSCIPIGFAIGRGYLQFNVFTVCLPYIVFMIVLGSWQRLRSLCCPLVVFLDRLCIAQHDPKLKEQGIMGLAAFLDISKESAVLHPLVVFL